MSVMELTARKREILRRVVEEYVATGQPVGSKALVERPGLDVSSSTVRSELSELEVLGLLSHPHTSAGRVPTENGYRESAISRSSWIIKTGLRSSPASPALRSCSIQRSHRSTRQLRARETVRWSTGVAVTGHSLVESALASHASPPRACRLCAVCLRCSVSCLRNQTPNSSIERTFQSLLRGLWPAAHVER